MTEQQFNNITKWQHETFKEANALSKMYHLKKEVDEVIADLTNYPNERVDPRDEYADCFLLLFGSAAAYGMTYEEIIECIQRKFEKNKARKWGKPDVNGVVEHIKE